MNELLTKLGAHFQALERDLHFVEHRLNAEFSSSTAHSDATNPLHLIERLKKMREEIPALKHRTEHVLRAKQELVGTTQADLISSLHELEALHGRLRLDTEESEGPTPRDLLRTVEGLLAQWKEQQRALEDEDPV
eukprot:gnl/Trimastix_PCT/4404.p1 GENE.gnl/Trimastix_PCT/4404~~gnl/Trimastix_PCT/4404.p1  ORF type:complete len:135 (-),score=45.80 gnl/Trimastix_PCT/4404:19-423(-)